MKIIILAAGQGTRLRPLTNDRPKCMVELNGKPLLHYQLEVLEECGIDNKDIAIVGGYLQEALVAPGIQRYTNKDYMTTNMVATLFAAQEFMQTDEDLVIAYSDIVYKPEIFQKLLDTKGDLVLAADQDWYQLWKMRMDNPLEDAETFKMTEAGQVVELGKKLTRLEDAQAQYIGLIKIAAHKVRDFIEHYYAMDKQAMYDGKDFNNMFMTSLIQHMIDNGWQAQVALVNNGWVEVDSVEDLEVYGEYWQY